MAEREEKLTELKIEKEAITATLEELKKAFEGGEISEEDYNSSKKDYEDRLASIESQIKDMEVEKPEEIEKPKPDYKAMEWDELRELAKERGIPVAGKGITREIVEKAMVALDEGKGLEEAIPKIEVPVPEEVPEKVPEVPVPEEVPEIEVKKEIDPEIIAQVEMVRSEIPSLNSTLTAFKMKRQVSESSLGVVKKNRDDGLIDSATYNNLKSKYEREIKLVSEKINEIERSIKAREKIVSEYENLVETQSDYLGRIKSLEREIEEKEREKNFMESGKLYMVANLREHLSGLVDQLKEIEEGMSAGGASYPDEAFFENLKKEIENEKENLQNCKSRIDNFNTLLESLEKERGEEEIDEETYNLLKSEYSREKDRSTKTLGRIEGKLKMMENDREAYEKLSESLESCKSYVNITWDSFWAIWKEEELKSKIEEISQLKNNVKTLENEMSKKLETKEKDLGRLLAELV